MKAFNFEKASQIIDSATGTGDLNKLKRKLGSVTASLLKDESPNKMLLQRCWALKKKIANKKALLAGTHFEIKKDRLCFRSVHPVIIGRAPGGAFILTNQGRRYGESIKGI